MSARVSGPQLPRVSRCYSIRRAPSPRHDCYANRSIESRPRWEAESQWGSAEQPEHASKALKESPLHGLLSLEGRCHNICDSDPSTEHSTRVQQGVGECKTRILILGWQGLGLSMQGPDGFSWNSRLVLRGYLNTSMWQSVEQEMSLQGLLFPFRRWIVLLRPPCMRAFVIAG